jgi:GNAT superfamily N-acetyltransferase
MTEIHPVTPDRLGDLADLFNSNNATKGCWCMAYIVSRSEYYRGRRGGHRESFEQMAASADPPMGLLAYREGHSVGWCALGPRTRYPPAISPRATILRDRDASEDDNVWLVPCFFVRVGERRQGITRELLKAAEELARGYGASAIEGWPLATGGKRSPDSYLGRQETFEACGFECVRRPSARRSVMRKNLC